MKILQISVTLLLFVILISCDNQTNNTANSKITDTEKGQKQDYAFGDATNEKVSADPVAGYIPAYTVLDLSGTYRLKRYLLKAGINNLIDKAYFTRRRDEYPGPGIIPSNGRSFYVGISAKF